MKKLLTAFALFASLSAVSTAAADNYAGIYTTGAQYQADLDATSAYRVGIGFNNGFNDLGVSADYLKDLGINPLSNQFGTYWGVGAGVGLENGFSLSPRAFVGLDYSLNAGTSVYGELGGRYVYYFKDSVDAVNGFDPYYRAGINFRLN